MEQLTVQIIQAEDHKEVVLRLLKQLNQEMSNALISDRFDEMIQMPNYLCFGLFEGGQLIGISSGWTTVRSYCGKQLEVDNVVIDSALQSGGRGKFFMAEIRKWCIENGYEAIGLNSYVQNSRSHKFYLNDGFKILGFHFEQGVGDVGDM